MDIYRKWTIQMQNNINGVMLPQTDPVDRSVFYVSDGWLSAYAGMRLRKLSTETGEELANVVTKDATRCLFFDKEYIYAFLSKRILKLNRDNLTIADLYKERIPRYTDYVDSDGAYTFLCANYNADSLSIFNFRTGCTRRKKIGGCCGIFKTGPDSFLIFNYDSILEYSLEACKLHKMADTEKYTQCARGKSGRAYLLVPPDCKILVYALGLEARLEKVISIPREIYSHLYCAMAFRLSEDEKWLYLFDAKSIWVYSIPEDKIIFQHTFSSDYIRNVFVEKPFVITSCGSQEEHGVAGWEIDPA